MIFSSYSFDSFDSFDSQVSEVIVAVVVIVLIITIPLCHWSLKLVRRLYRWSGVFLSKSTAIFLGSRRHATCYD